MKQYHIALDETQIARYVILPGDPGRCEAIARYLDGPAFVARNREYTTWEGYLGGERVLVTSTGIGGPSAAIALEDLAALGADTFIRAGTCGGIALEVCGGDVVIASGAVRHEGTSREYAPLEYPAVPGFAVLNALARAAGELALNHHIGVVHCKDSFYGQHSPARMPVADELLYKWEAWRRLGVLASEMESAALFTAAAALGVRAGACFSVVWNKDRRAQGLPDDERHDPADAVRLAVRAMELLIESGG
ncbi:MAG: uridine phosphorylase [Oscillospiraceae bacterium]|nr:uridine phosphorylase [Oscillospiraceae bacterium]